MLNHYIHLKTLVHVERNLKWKIQRLSPVSKFPTDTLYNENVIIILIA